MCITSFLIQLEVFQKERTGSSNGDISINKSGKKALSFILISLFIYLFLAALGLCCCTWAFSSCGERGLLFVAVRRLLIEVASLVVGHRLQACGLSSCGAPA